MSQHHRVRPRPAAIIILLGSFIVAACGGVGSAGPSSAPETTTTGSTAPASAEPAGTPAPTDMVQMGIPFLPEASIDPSTVQVACDDAADAAGASCDDLVALTARIAETMSAGAPTRINVVRSTDDPNVITVTFWTPAEEAEGETAFTTTIDLTNQTFTFPTEDPEATFPG
jgi:hypothetical protein